MAIRLYQILVFVIGVTVVALVAHAINWAGPQFALGGAFGFFLCYVMFKNWRQDDY